MFATLLPHEARDHLEQYDRIRVHDVDVTREEDVVAFKKAVQAATDAKLDVLVNNASVWRAPEL